MSSPIRSDWASVPMRGSRLRGELSMSTTAVSAAGFWRSHPAKVRQSASTDKAKDSLRIAQLAQDDFAFGPGSAGKVGGFMLPALVGEHSEGDGLLCLRGHPGGVRGCYLDAEAGHLAANHVHQRPVAGASAGDEQIVVLLLLRQSAYGLADGACRERRG